MAVTSDFIAYNQVTPGHDFMVDRKVQPYAKPPKYTELDDVVNFYAERLFAEKHSERLNFILEDYGVPVNTLTRILLTNSVAAGVHNMYMSTCVAPIVREMLISNADLAGINYTTSMADLSEDKITGIDAEMLSRRMDKMREEEMLTPQPAPQEEVMEEEPAVVGLISRPTQTTEEGMM